MKALYFLYGYITITLLLLSRVTGHLTRSRSISRSTSNDQSGVAARATNSSADFQTLSLAMILLSTSSAAPPERWPGAFWTGTRPALPTLDFRTT